MTYLLFYLIKTGTVTEEVTRILCSCCICRHSPLAKHTQALEGYLHWNEENYSTANDNQTNIKFAHRLSLLLPFLEVCL